MALTSLLQNESLFFRNMKCVQRREKKESSCLCLGIVGMNVHTMIWSHFRFQIGLPTSATPSLSIQLHTCNYFSLRVRDERMKDPAPEMWRTNFNPSNLQVCQISWKKKMAEIGIALIFFLFLKKAAQCFKYSTTTETIFLSEVTCGFPL